MLSQDSKSSLLSFIGLKVLCHLLFKDYPSLQSCRDNQGHLLLYFSKTIIVFCLVQTIKVICSFTFQRLSESFVLQRQSRSSASLHFKDYHSLLSCRDNQGHLLLYFSKTIIVFFMLSKGDNAFIYISKDDNVFSNLCFQNATMPSFTFQKTTMSSVIYVFKR